MKTRKKFTIIESFLTLLLKKSQFTTFLTTTYDKLSKVYKEINDNSIVFEALVRQRERMLRTA
jgi:hypothetical protein